MPSLCRLCAVSVPSLCRLCAVSVSSLCRLRVVSLSSLFRLCVVFLLFCVVHSTTLTRERSTTLTRERRLENIFVNYICRYEATILGKNDWLSIDWSIYCGRTEGLYSHSNHSVPACYWDESDPHLLILHVKCFSLTDQLNDSKRDRRRSKFVRWRISLHRD